MPILTWTDEMSVGVKLLDDDHKALIRMLNRLHDGIESGESRAVLENVIEELSSYTRNHFAHEEKYFDQTNFPGGEAHKHEHFLLSRRVMNLQSRFECGQSEQLSLEAMDFIKQWLTDHIMGSDKQYSAHLNAKGIR